MNIKNKALILVIAFSAFSVLSTLIVLSLVSPSAGYLVFVAVYIFFISLLGPFSYPVMFPNHPINLPEGILLFAFASASIGLLILWKYKPIKFLPYLSAFIWVSLGGVLAFYGTAASI